jgi:hypothetical protein
VKLLAVPFLALLVAGAYPVRVPVEGLTARNAAELKSLLKARFNDKDYRVEDVDVAGGAATIWCACLGGFKLAEVEAALKDSPFSLKPATWELYGRVTLTWTAAEIPGKLEKALAEFEACEVKGTKSGDAFRIETRIVFGEGKSATVARLNEIVAAHGAKDPAYSWDNETLRGEHHRVECGARRVAK